MAQGACDVRALIGANTPERLAWVLARLIAMFVWFAVATACSLLAHISTYVEGAGGWIEVTSTAFIGDAQAKRKPEAGANGQGQPPQANGRDKVEQEAPGAGKPVEPSGEPAGDEPPKTVAEAIGNLVKWMQSKPQAEPPRPQAEVGRAAEKGAAPGQLANKGRSAKKSTTTPEPAEPNAAKSIVALPLPGTYKPNELLVFGASATVLRELGLRGWRQTAGAGKGVVRLVSDTQDPIVARAQLQSEMQGASFGLNFVYHLADDGTPARAANAASGLGSCDPQRCYAAPLIKWKAGLAACAAGITIGIIDTAVDTTHPALAWKKLQVRRKSDVTEAHAHGTGVLSLLTGDPNSDTAGLVPDADYVIADAFYKNASGTLETDTDHLLWALSVLEQHGAQVVNMSLSGPRDPLIHRRLGELKLKGMVFVAAAGNGGPDAPSAYPAAYEEEVIAVTAVDRNQRVYDQANRGRYIDVAAPGVRIWTALPNGKSGVQSGTSFAAPFITAIVASIYKHALLPASSDTSGSDTSGPRIPEALTLAHLSTKKSVRDDTIGLGLVTAPSNCAPDGEHKTLPDLPIATLKRWETRVDFASSRGAN